MKDEFAKEADDTDEKKTRFKLLRSGLTFDPTTYEVNDSWVKAKTPLECHSTAEMLEFMKADPSIQLEARVLGTNGSGQKRQVRMNRAAFMEASKARESKRLRESMDSFQYDDGSHNGNLGGPIGKDFTPLLGGPFNKQLYYRDYLRMIAACFFSYHHDPVARDIVSIMVDFTMGRGFQLKTTGRDAAKAQILWDAFSEANDIPGQMEHAGVELSIYGENMWWWLPHHQTRISFNPAPGEVVPRGIIPRVRLIDPSNIIEIVTVPEDPVKGVIHYVWLAPTQYQIYSDGKQPTTKFIYTQIPAAQMQHYKVNAVSNEKRGRSDYFPALGYMKRLRDSVNYSLVAQQKAAAWSMDTTVKGNDEDIDAYIASQQALGSMPTAGSEFVHTEAIVRTYLANQGTGKSSDSPTFNWCLNMICMSSGIPIGYLGTHLSGGSTRASALVATEPVAKRFERRRLVYDRMVYGLFDKLMRTFNLQADCESIWPELITQDRTAKLRDLLTAQNASWLSHERCASMAAKEFDQQEFDYAQEMLSIKKQDEELGLPSTKTAPLTTPGQNGQTGKDSPKSNGTLTAPEKTAIKNNSRNL